MTDDELLDTLRKMDHICDTSGKGFYIMFHGWDDDPRGLWDIPEAVALMKKIVEMGFLSVLHPVDPPDNQPEHALAGLLFTGAHVKAIADGTFDRRDDGSISPQIDVIELMRAINEANERCGRQCSPTDPAAGSGAMLTETLKRLRKH